MRTAIAIIDMINEYANPNGTIYCKNALDIVPSINKLIHLGRNLNWDIIFVNTELVDNESILIKKWGPQAKKGTWNCEIISELDHLPNDIIVPKTTFDGFYKTELENVLKTNGDINVIMTGIHTHVCVHFTAMSAANRGFNVVAIEECMTTGYLENHTSRLRLYKTHIGELYRIGEFLENGYKKYIDGD